MYDKYEGLEAKSSKGLESDHTAAPGKKKASASTEQNAGWTSNPCRRCRE
jgi:hypothetical protein